MVGISLEFKHGDLTMLSRVRQVMYFEICRL